MTNTAVIGVAFTDVKGFAKSKYDPQGRNLGEIKIVHGGVCRNVVENFANVGMPVSFVGLLDETPFGKDVEQHLMEAGADVSRAVKVPAGGIGMWLVILDENGNQAGSISRMPDVSALESYLFENGERIIRDAEAVVLEVDLSERIAEKVISLCRQYHKKIYSIVANLSVILRRKDLIRLTDCFICNEIEAGKYFGCCVADYSPEEMETFLAAAAKEDGLQSVVVTMGGRGSVFYDSKTGQTGFCPPCPTTVVDTSGAGDAFFSGTVMALIRGCALCDAVNYGARLASATINREETNCPVNKHFFD